MRRGGLEVRLGKEYEAGRDVGSRTMLRCTEGLENTQEAHTHSPRCESAKRTTVL
jgi:hypothetical protein